MKFKMNNWTKCKIADIASFSQGIQVDLKNQIKEKKEGYVRFIRIVDYTQKTEDIRYIKDPGEKYYVDKDDIVMVRYGSPGLIGRGEEGVIANNLFKIKIESDKITNDYLAYYLSQKHIQKFLSSQGSSTMPALNFGQLRTVDVFFPSIEEQNKIVDKLKIVIETLNTTKEIYKKQIDNVIELESAYFEKAFKGNL
jgi:type I restriction enzyme S subunit